MYVVAIGNAFDGLSVHGPFESSEEAQEWAQGYHDEWHVLLLREAPVVVGQ